MSLHEDPIYANAKRLLPGREKKTRVQLAGLFLWIAFVFLDGRKQGLMINTV